jgi:hypothetical protein
VDAPVAASEPRDELDGPHQGLLLLLPPTLFVGIGADIGDLVVVDRHGNEYHVVDDAALIRLGHIGEEPESRLAQLPRPGTAPFDVPLQGEPLLEEVVEVLAQDELVRLVVLELPSDEEDARPAQQGTDEKEVHVDATRRVVEGEPVLE